MWIVRLALRRPYTFVVVALLIVALGMVTIVRMSTDIFPNVDIPVVTVIWSSTGISPDDMEKRVVTISERAFTTTVNDIEHMESQSHVRSRRHQSLLPSERQDRDGRRRRLPLSPKLCCAACPPGSTPPLIIRYSASSVPILQLSITSRRCRRNSSSMYA